MRKRPELPSLTLVNRPSHPLERADRQNPDPRSQLLGPNRRALEHAADSFRIDVNVVGLIANKGSEGTGPVPRLHQHHHGDLDPQSRAAPFLCEV